MRRAWMRWAAALLVAAAPAVARPAPALSATSPTYSVSEYVVNPDPSQYYNRGCQTGRSATQNGPAVGIVVLDFGQPQALGDGEFGTLDFGYHLDSISLIGMVARQWLQGFWDCTPAVNYPAVKLAVGTSNYRGATTYEHGQAWGRMINEINSWIQGQGYQNELAARGANDLEVGWNTPTATREWVDGYNAVGQYPLYDYGDDAGGITPGNGWTADDVVYVAWNARQNWPLPEIYNAADATADWQPLSLWAYQHTGAAISFVGTMTEYALDADTLTPYQGWQALYDALSADPRTAQAALSYATDITRGD